MNNMFLFERSLDNKVEEVIKRYSGGKQSLVFCASKSGMEYIPLIYDIMLIHVRIITRTESTSS